MAEQQSILDLTTSWERKGHTEGQIEILLRLAEKRFKYLSQDDRAIIGGLSSSELEELADAIIDVSSYEEWRARLLACARQAAKPETYDGTGPERC